jgi:helix-turn-helix protein
MGSAVDDCFASLEKCLAEAKRTYLLHQRLPGGSRTHDTTFTIAELAEWLGYSQDIIRRAIRAAELPAMNLPGPGGKPSYRVTLADFITWLKDVRKYDPVRVAILERVARRGRSLITLEEEPAIDPAA